MATGSSKNSTQVIIKIMSCVFIMNLERQRERAGGGEERGKREREEEEKRREKKEAFNINIGHRDIYYMY